METRYTKRFVLPIDLSQQLVDFSESSRVNVALRCVNSIQRLQESIQSETPVVVSARVALSEDAWNVRAYKNGEELPVENVPLKVNVLRTLTQTLQEYSKHAGSHVETVAKTLQYLNKLVQASLLPKANGLSASSSAMSMGPPSRKPTHLERELTHRSSHTSRIAASGESTDNASHFSAKSSGNKSMVSTKSKRSIFQKMKEIRWSKSSHPDGNPDSNQSSQNYSQRMNASKPHPHRSAAGQHRDTHSKQLKKNNMQFKRQDLNAMPEYISWIQQLAVHVLALPQTTQNDIIFSFINKCIIPFLIHDAYLLQIGIIQTRVLAFLDVSS